MAANRHPGFIPNQIMLWLVKYYIQVPPSGVTGFANTLPVPFLTDSGTAGSPGVKVKFINRPSRGKVKDAKVVKMRQGLKT